MPGGCRMAQSTEVGRMTVCAQTLARKDPFLSPGGWTHLETAISEVWGLEALQRASRGLTYTKGLAGDVGILAPRHQGQQLGLVLFHKLFTLLPV